MRINDVVLGHSFETPNWAGHYAFEKDIVLWLEVTTWNAGNRFYCLHFSTWDIQTLVDLVTGNWDDYPSGSNNLLDQFLVRPAL
jgi:hypothetical protein